MARRRKPLRSAPLRPKRKGKTPSWFAFWASWLVSASAGSLPGRCSGARPVSEGAAGRDGGVALPRASQARCAFRVRGTVRPLQPPPAAAAAGHAGLSRGLLQLPRPELRRVPQSSATSVITRRRSARSPTEWTRKVSTTNPDDGSAMERNPLPADRIPAALSERGGRPERQQQRAAARSQPDHQGPTRRRALHLFAADRLSRRGDLPQSR